MENKTLGWIMPTIYQIKSAAKKNRDGDLADILRKVYDTGFKDGSGCSSDLSTHYECGACGGELDLTIEARFCYHCGAELDFNQLEEKEE